MRIQCDVCEKAPASIMCCADEAALCADCDTRVHGANKLANKHQRISLNRTVGDSPRCDICQEKSAFFFCLEDRALLCRDCDLSIHSATALSSAHQRFLVPGSKVALEALSNNPEAAPEQQAPVEEFVRHPLSSMINSPAMISNNYQQPQQQKGMNTATPTNSSNSSGVTSHGYASPNHSRPAASQVPAQSYSAPAPVKMTTSYPQKSMNVSSANSAAESTAGNGGVAGDGHAYGMPSSLTRRTSITDFLSDAIPNWRVDELLNIPDLADGYSLGDVASSKADVSNLGDYDWTSDLSLFDEQFYADKFHEVPQMGSPPPVPLGAMGGHGRLGRGGHNAMKGKAKQHSMFSDYDDGEFLVPDLGLHAAPASPPAAKRRRQLVV